MKPTINLNHPLPFYRLLYSYILSHPRLILSLLFTFSYIFAIAWYHPLSAHDPSSFFFSASHGYDKSYSTTREAQALAFINATNAQTGAVDISPLQVSTSPSLCLGVATVSRPTTQYITLTIGSLFDGLTAEERSKIHFVFFIAHTDPTTHPVYHEPWTQSLPDTQLTYAGLSSAQITQLREWESTHDYRSKGLFDYSYLLSTCASKTLVPYIAILEGDVLAVRGWYPRAIAAADHIDSLDPHDEDNLFDATPDLPAANTDPPPSSWLYLRLFHTETYLGWNKEFWTTYLFNSTLVFLTLGIALITLRAIFPYALSRSLSNPTLALILLVFLPLSITLFFALGRPTVLPLPRPYPSGAQQMVDFGCCSQGFVFPRRMVPWIKRRIEERAVDYIDMLMEAAAGKWGLEKWVVVPSLLQHLGGTSSKGDPVADERARTIWSFGFERWGHEGAGPP